MGNIETSVPKSLNTHANKPTYNSMYTKKNSSMPSMSSCRGSRILWFFFGQLLEFNLQVFTLHLKRENRCPGFSAATNLSSPVQSFSSLPIHQAVQPTPATATSGFKWLIFEKILAV